MGTLRDVFPQYLHTPRLTLELFDATPPHYRCILDVMNSRTAHANMGDFGIRTPAQFDRLCDTCNLQGERFGNGIADQTCHYLIRLRSDDKDGELIGAVSLCQRVADTTVLPPDIGWGLLEPHMGRGYATEAAAELLRYAREDLGYSQVVVFPNDRNLASNQVAAKLGFVDGGEVPNVDEPGTMIKVLTLPGTGHLGLQGGLSFRLR